MNPEKISLQDAIGSLAGRTSEEKKEQPISSGATPSRVSEHGSQNSSLKSLRTFQGDVEEAVHNGKNSIVSIAVAEQKRKIEERETNRGSEIDTQYEASRLGEFRNKSFAIIGIILFVLGFVIIGGVYALKYFNSKTAVVAQSTLVSFTTEAILPSIKSQDELVNFLQTQKTSYKAQSNSVLYMHILNTDSQTALGFLSPNIPQTLLRALDTQYMFGIYANSTNEPFILLTTSDYANAFNGMLKWEETMPADLGKLFSIPVNTSTTTAHVFTDEATSNKDLRILSNANGKTILLYTFLDKHTILITSTEEVFNAMLGKFVTNKLVR